MRKGMSTAEAGKLGGKSKSALKIQAVKKNLESARAKRWASLLSTNGHKALTETRT